MDRIVEIEKFSSDETYESSLRPSDFDGYIGQDNIKKNLHIFISAAKKRGECLDHIPFSGPAGLDKTTLTNIIATEMGANIKTTTAPVMEKSGDLAAILTNLSKGDVLFIDEIHRLSPAVEEVLYPVVEDFRLNIIIGNGPAAQAIEVDLPKSTLIGATIKAGMLSNPLRDHFGMQFHLEFYKNEELALVPQKATLKLNKNCEEKVALEIAKRSRSAPGIALRLLKRVRDFADISDEESISLIRAYEVLNSLGVNELDLGSMDLRYLELLTSAKGKAVGLTSITAALGEDGNMVEDVIEPYLLANGYIERTAKGCIASIESYHTLKLNHEKTLLES